MTALLQVAKLIDVLSASGGIMSREELMRKIRITNVAYFENLLSHARIEIGIFTIMKPGGFVGYKINYEESHE